MPPLRPHGLLLLLLLLGEGSVSAAAPQERAPIARERRAIPRSREQAPLRPTREPSPVRLGGLVREPDGRTVVVDVGRAEHPPRLLRLDAPRNRIEVLSAGGFLREPRGIVVDGASLLVADRSALGGAGAVVRIDRASGRQDVLAYGGWLRHPERLEHTTDGRLLARGGDDDPVVEIDLATGAQRAFGSRASETRPRLATGSLQGPGRAQLGGEADEAEPEADASPGGVTGTAGPRDGGFRRRFQAPPRAPIAEDSVVLIPDIVWLPHGEGLADDVLIPAGPYPLVTALKAATPGTNPTIGVYGDIPGAGMSIGAGDSDLKDYVVHWGPVPMRFTVIGRNEDARIREFDLRQVMNDGTVNGGIADVRFENLTIEARFTSAVSVPRNQTVGMVRFYDCHFAAGRESLAVGDYDGYGYKWGVRGHGRGRWDFRGCTFEPVEEHCVYVDSPQGDCYFVDIEHRGSKRTAIQVVNRSLDNPGPSGFGTLLFEDVRVYDLWGDGGSGISVAGHLGDLVFRDIQARENPAHAGSHGAIVVWTDADPEKGVYLYTGADGGLYSTRSVTLESMDTDLPGADRPHVAISGVERVDIRNFTTRGARTAFSFDSSFGAPVVNGPAVVDGTSTVLANQHILNGSVSFGLPCPLSGFAGFQTSSKVMVLSSNLTSGEIDARWCP